MELHKEAVSNLYTGKVDWVMDSNMSEAEKKLIRNQL